MQKRLQSASEIRRSILLGIAVGIGIGIVFGAGFFFRDLIGDRFLLPSSVSGDYALLREVQGLLDRHYLREQPDIVQREYAAIRGMLQSLGDPYTFFIDPPVAASESDALAGAYGGIGVQVQRNAEGELILYPFNDSPALSAGIDAGDILRAINGSPIDVGLSNDAIDQMLRGEVREGNGVELTVDKTETGESLTVFVPFAVINVPSVVWRTLPENQAVGYIQVMRFTSRTPDELRQGLTELNAAEVEALMLDLRNNNGGLLQESITVADEFLEGGTIVTERSNRGDRLYTATNGGLGVELPLVVLVNEGTASGAELVAGALQDNDRAILIGQTTYGKGTVQQIFPLQDGSSLHVTSAEWFTPDQQRLNENGLQPDIVTNVDPSGRDVELEAALAYLVEQGIPETALESF